MAREVKTCKYCGEDFKSKDDYLAHIPCDEYVGTADFELAQRIWTCHFDVSMKRLGAQGEKVDTKVSSKRSK